jgi:hypothetical protein
MNIAKDLALGIFWMCVGIVVTALLLYELLSI